MLPSPSIQRMARLRIGWTLFAAGALLLLLGVPATIMAPESTTGFVILSVGVACLLACTAILRPRDILTPFTAGWDVLRGRTQGKDP
jgi:hypothetical protein